MPEQFSEEELKTIRDKCTDRRTDKRYSVLSQDEIDTLLSAYQSANPQSSAGALSKAKERQIRLYDFARPERLSKEHLRALQSIYEGFAVELATELSALCAAPTRVDLISIDQATYQQYRGTISPKTLLADVVVSSVIADVFISLSSSIVGVWVDYLCGGNTSAPAAPSDLTSIELAVVKKVLTRIVAVYSSIWPRSAGVKAEIRRAVDAELYDESAMAASEAVMVCSFELQTGPAVGMMTICMPAIGVEQMMPLVSAVKMPARTLTGGSAEAKGAVSGLRLQCRVILGKASVSLSELTSLSVGDVMRTDKRIGDDAELWIGGQHVFDCRVGKRRGAIAAVISNLAEGAEMPSAPLVGATPRPEPAPAAWQPRPVEAEPDPVESQDNALAEAA